MRHAMIWLALLILVSSCRHDPTAEDYFERGLAWAREGDHELALSDYTRAVELNPKFAEAFYNRAYTWWKLGDVRKAIADFTRVIELRPHEIKAYVSRAYRWRIVKEYGRAMSDYEKVLELDPEHLPAVHHAARLLATCPEEAVRDGEKAVILAKRAVRLKKARDTLDTLAAAYAEAGRFKEAVKIQTKALALLGPGSAALREYRKRLEQYRRDRPVREK